MKKIILIILSTICFCSSAIAETTIIYSGSADGHIRNRATTWDGARNATTGDEVNNSNHDSWGGWTLLGDYYVERAWFVFDTSDISGNISTASIFLYPVDVGNDGVVCIQEGTQGASLTTDDFDAFTGESCGTTTWDRDKGDYIEIELNTTGIAAINAGGTTYFCLRSYTKDFLNSAPTAFSDSGKCYYSEESGTSKDPYLSITTVTYEISGTIKEKSCDSSGTTAHYIIFPREWGTGSYTFGTSSGEGQFWFGTSASDGTYSENVYDDAVEYNIIAIDDEGIYNPIILGEKVKGE